MSNENTLKFFEEMLEKMKNFKAKCEESKKESSKKDKDENKKEEK